MLIPFHTSRIECNTRDQPHKKYFLLIFLHQRVCTKTNDGFTNVMSGSVISFTTPVKFCVMINIQEFIEKSPFAKTISVDHLLFAEFKCPLDEKKSNIWWHNNFFAHVLTGETVLQTPRGKYVLKPGDSAFAKKGSVITHNKFTKIFVNCWSLSPTILLKPLHKNIRYLSWNLLMTTAIL